MEPVLGLTDRECIERLNGYRDDIRNIISLLEDKSHLDAEEKARARSLLKKLKDSIGADCSLRETKRGQNQMTKVEKIFYWPAIREAYANHLKRIRSNTQPNQGWLMDLREAESDMLDCISEITSYRGQ
jgi:preprotein translocase subunit SecA